MSLGPSVRRSVGPSDIFFFSNCGFKKIHVNSIKLVTFCNYWPSGGLVFMSFTAFFLPSLFSTSPPPTRLYSAPILWFLVRTDLWVADCVRLLGLINSGGPGNSLRPYSVLTASTLEVGDGLMADGCWLMAPGPIIKCLGPKK